MENDLIFGAESSDALFGAAADMTQIAAMATPMEEPVPTPRDAAQVVVPQGATVVRVSVAPGEVVELPFPADAHFLARLEDGNLAIKVGDLTIILKGYADAAGEATPVIEAADGQPLDIAAILAATDPAIEIETAAGPAGAQGQGADNTGALLTQFGGAGGGLGGFTAAGGQDGSDAPTGGPGVDQTGTLFRQFGASPIPTAPNAPDFKFATDEESGITRKVVATDPQGDVLTYAVVGAKPAGLTFNPDGTWSFDPAGKYDQLNTDNPGQVSFQYKASDGTSDSNVATVTIDIAGVNDAPVLTNGTIGVGFFEDTSDSRELGWQIADPDDKDITITPDQSTLPAGITYDSSTGTIHYEAGHYDYLKTDETGRFTVKFTVADAHGGSIEQNLTVTIVGENDAPVAADDIVLTNAGTFEAFDVPSWALLVNDKDVDGDRLTVSPMFPGTGLDNLGYVGGDTNNHFIVEDDATLGGSFEYKVRDGSETSEIATVTIQNQDRGDITGTDANEILIGDGSIAQTLDGAGGNDILIANASGINTLFGGSGDDVIAAFNRRSTYHGGTDTVALSGGLAAGAGNHGDVLAIQNSADLADFVSELDEGIETISTQAKFGGVGTQSLTVCAASVRQLSDHTITPGGGFDEHDAIRIDGDDVDKIVLSSDGGKWVDTAIEMAGYRIYAHETTDGDPTSTDAYVMVQLANVGNVQFPPVAADDIVLSNSGTFGSIVVPEWALLANDQAFNGTNLDVRTVNDFDGAAGLGHTYGAGSNGHIEFDDEWTLGGWFKYQATDGIIDSKDALVTVHNQETSSDINGTAADEILVGTYGQEHLDGGGGNDILIGSLSSSTYTLSGGSGDDILAGRSNGGDYHGGTDTVASSGGLAAGPDNHGDVLAVQNAAFRLAELADQAKLDGIETISTEEKLGGLGTQTLKISAANVQQLSDHTIAPGGGFGEHDAIRIDGDSVDQIQLRSDAGKWVDTTIEMAGYRIYAHETTDGNPASADAYVMVQAANTGNVHLNPPVARDDRILTTVGTNADFSVPEWALLANDTGGTKLDLAGVVDYTGLSLISWNTAAGTNENVTVSEDDTRGGSFKYQATDGDTVSETATVSIFNAPGGIGSSDADEILVGSAKAEILAGNGGNDIIFSGGTGDEIYGGDGDDIIELNQPAHIYGGTDSVAQSGGLAAGAGNHGDVLISATNLSLVDVTNIESVETISTEEKFGGVGAQTVTIDAASVRQLSDHTITPGGAFAEHDAIRIDGDSVDRLYLAIGADGGQWVDTGIAVAGYRVYAHETTGGDAASTDAYVMVQAANAGNVHLNQDGAPVAGNDSILTNAGPSGTLVVPEWALLANDQTVDGAKLTVDPNFYGATGFQSIAHIIGGSSGAYELTDNTILGGEFGYKATDGGVMSQVALVDVQNRDGGDIAGTDADEILIGTAFGEKIDGGGGNDIIFGVDGQRDEIFGGAGDDVVDFINLGSSFHGGTDTVASSGGLAAGMDVHGDVLIRRSDLDLASSVFAAELDGIETLSTQEKYGAIGAQTITIGAGSVRQLSDHTITPGGGFGEHDAIRIDGDSVDQVYLSTSADGGQWIDTAIEMAGYRIYAHETTGGDPASTDAYVMVQAANVGQVRFAPVAGNDTVLTNVGTDITFAVPEWALLANDTGGKNLDVSDGGFNGFSGLNGLTHIPDVGSKGRFDVDEDDILGGSFEYKATNGLEVSAIATVAIQNHAGGDLTGTAAQEIIVSGAAGDKIDGKGSKDLIFGGDGDDTVIFHNGDTVQGGSDSIAKNDALAISPSRGDVLGLDHDADFTKLDLAHFGSVETISTLNADTAAAGAQSLTIGAATVNGISDHTITPGGVFGEHEAIRIDGDTVDQLYLSISKDGGKWVDTSIETAGYHIFAHETTGGDPVSTDAYVMVQASNVGNVHLNQDAP